MTNIRRMVAVVAILALGSGCAYLNGNFRTVYEDEFYRSGQMGPNDLERALRVHEIQTVVSFRGANPDEEWYRAETAVCAELEVPHHDLKWSKSRLPEPESLAEFLRLCREAPKPMLVHCQGGTHRTGVASACYVLLKGGDMDEAREQLGLLFGDAPIGRLLDLYEGSPLPLEEWCATEYPAIYAAETAARQAEEDAMDEEED